MPQECPNCERTFKTRACPSCGWSRTKSAQKTAPVYVVARETRPLHELYPPPATEEEARQHIKRILAMLSGTMDANRPKVKEDPNAGW